MTKIDNDQNVKKIVMKPFAFTKCEIGGDWYKNSLIIIMHPNDAYPDYIEVQQWIMENIDGKTLNIEDVAFLIKSKLEREFNPYFIKVTDVIKGCKTHFDVIVEI